MPLQKRWYRRRRNLALPAYSFCNDVSDNYGGASPFNELFLLFYKKEENELKKIISCGVLAFVLVLGLLLTGCTDHDGIYDDAAALGGEDKYSQVLSSQNNRGDSVTYTASSLSGMVTLAQVKAGDETAIIIVGSFGVEEGKAKIIITGPDGFLMTLDEALAGQENTLNTVVTVSKGTYKVRVVGQGAKNVHAELEVTKSNG